MDLTVKSEVRSCVTVDLTEIRGQEPCDSGSD